ncbi:MAG TPA: hypothetical protein VNB64_03155 [Solirubrobacteraceae bacterium]|nr:hypothetical protein [Solirubrobacteraceae bacterium]
MTRRVLLSVCALVGALLLLPATALAARPKAPVVTSIAPKKLGVGDVLTIRGRHFVAGRFKNTVVFQRARSRAVFLRADRATTTKIRIRITSKLQPFLAQRAGQPEHTRFKIRVLARRFGIAFTTRRLSPLIGPPTGQVPVPAASPDCDRDGVSNAVETDDDNDLLTDEEETRFKLNACAADSDADGMEDGWEYYSALDLNSRAVPFPGRRPYPNPLDGADAKYDHDGDGLTQTQEYAAWVRYGNHQLLTPEEATASRLLYSDGDQQSFDESAQIATKPWLDREPDGRLTDDERDADNDGLRNYWEANGPGTARWWEAFFKDEKPYMTPFPELDWLDPDTDGDSVVDGQDDQDHDDWSNIQELVGDRPDGDSHQLYGLRGTDLMVHPYNPCLPNYKSRTCSRYIPAEGEAWPPFANVPQPLPALPYGDAPEIGLHWPVDWS